MKFVVSMLCPKDILNNPSTYCLDVGWGKNRNRIKLNRTEVACSVCLDFLLNSVRFDFDSKKSIIFLIQFGLKFSDRFGFDKKKN